VDDTLVWAWKLSVSMSVREADAINEHESALKKGGYLEGVEIFITPD